MSDLRAFVARHAWPVGFVAVLIFGVIVRVVILARASWMLDGDEATMVIVGRHIQHLHERPIFFPGQAYMAAWQAYVAALFFELFGASRPVAKLVPLTASAAFIATTMLLARRVYDRNLALLAGLFAALPSIYLLSATLRISYPLIDVLAIGNLILLIAVDSVWRSDAPPRFVFRALLLGLLAGFGFWLHAAILLFALPAGLVLLLRWPRLALIPGSPAALLGFVIGAAPVLQFARHHSYTTFDYLLGSDADTAQRSYLRIANHLVRTIFPRILGVSVPWESTPLLVQFAIGVPSVAALSLFAWHLRRAPLAWAKLQPHRGPPEMLVGVFGLTVVVAYLLSRFSVYALLFPTIDATGRYLAPLAAFLPLAFAGAVGVAWRKGKRWRDAALAGTALLLGATGLAWALATPAQVFQSPYFRHLPPHNDQLIAASDWVDLRVCNGLDRLGTLSSRVVASDDTAFVFVSPTGGNALASLLDQRGIRYELVVVDGYSIVHPLDGPLDPAEVADALWHVC